MKPRYRELVGRIPAAKMSGNAVQYYVEVKASDGALVKRIGKSTSPNVVYLHEAAQPRFYPDLDDTGAATEAAGRTNAYSTGDDEDPLAPKGATRVAEVPSGGGGGDGVAGGAGGGSFVDVGSSGFNKAKWIATGVGGGSLVLSVTFYAMASSWATSLEGEANASQSDDCPDRGGPPCRTYDDDRRNIEATGQRYETFYKVSLAVGVVASGVAGYLWWKEKKSGKKADRAASTATGLRSIVASPVAGDDFIGGAAALRF
jgi:hypothetical protein